MSAQLQTSGSKKEQIKQLLQANCSATEAAAAVGCDVSYVSQLMDDQDFATEVVAHRVKLLKENSDRDGKYDSLEDKLLEGLELKLEQGVFLMKTETILRAIQTINGAKRRGAQGTGAATVINNVINLTLPSHAIRQFQVNPENEVISVGAQQLVSMSAGKLLEKVKNNQSPIKDSLITQEIPRKDIIPYEPYKDSGELSRRVAEATISAEQI